MTVSALLTVPVAGNMPVVWGVLMAAAVLVFAMAVILIASDKRSALEKRLTGYGLEEAGPDPMSSQAVGKNDQLAETKLMQEMVGVAGRLAERVGLLNQVEEKLEQADLPLRPPEAVFLYLAGMFVVFVGSLLLFSIPLAVIMVVVTALGPVMWLEMRRKKRLRAFETQLPDTLNLMAGSMRAGFSFSQGLEAVADESSEPTRRELQRVVAESRLGRPVEDALEDAASRMHSVDLLWAVMAIRIQREVGGNLAELLDTVARTMTERERLKREIMALTAEGRMSAWILGIFPPLFGVVLYMVQPKYMNELFSSGLGITAVGVSAVVAVLGFVWLRKIMAIEV